MNDELPPALGKVTVLIVEDSPTQALKLEHLLVTHDFEVLTARDGHEALAQLVSHRPTLVLTDVNMPVMNGYELCRRIKSDAARKDLPVILLTSLSDPRDILKGLECGADNFISKPYDEEFLLSRIHHVIANLELRREAHGEEPVDIFFAGRRYKLTTDRIHSIDLLLTTYETAVQKNLELSRAKETLENQAEELREKNEQMREELQMARELQTAFLPHHYPVFPAGVPLEQSALRFSHRYLTTTELGGDFFDLLPLSDTLAGIFLCDVMGHGVRAALVTAIVRGLVEELRPAAADPGAFLTVLNQALCGVLRQTATPLFASALCVLVDLEKGEVRYANGGHPAPFHLRRRAGLVNLLKPVDVKPSPVLGVLEDSSYTTFTCPIGPGDSLLLFTDGLFELESSTGDFFDSERLRAAVSRRLGLASEALLDDLLDELKGFGKNDDFEDDVCVVAADLMRLVSPQPRAETVGSTRGD